MPIAESTSPAERHRTEASALSHLWVHSNDLQWGELADHGLQVFVEGNGSTLTDVHGRTYLDGLAGLFVVNAGHGRSEIAEAMARQASTLAYTAASHATNPAAVALADKLATLTPGDLNRIFFCSGGSESVETALKIAKQYQVLSGFPKRYKVICRRGAYHGATFGAMSLTSSASERYFGPFMAGVSKVPAPNRYRNEFGIEGEEGDLACARAVEQEILAQGPEFVAALIVEPLGVATGTHVASAAYFQELRRICDRHGVLLIFDEVVAAFGRAGKMFAAENFGVVPDIVTMAKGLSSGYAPIGAVAVSETIFEPFRESGNAINHILTYGGHAGAAAAAAKNIEILEEEDLPVRSAAMGARLVELLRTLESHPTVGDVRGGIGMIAAIELVKNKDSRQSWGPEHPFVKGLNRAIVEQGLVTRVWDVLHLAPPLVMTVPEMEQVVAVIDRCLTELEAEFADEIG